MRENPFMSFNHIKIGVVESDHAEVWLDIQPESTNIYGVVHVALFLQWRTVAQD